MLDIPPSDCDCNGNHASMPSACAVETVPLTLTMTVFKEIADDRVGAYDDRGICNGPGAIYIRGCADILAGDVIMTEISPMPSVNAVGLVLPTSTGMASATPRKSAARQCRLQLQSGRHR